MSSIAATQSGDLAGMHLALGAGVVATLASVALTSARLRPVSPPSARAEPLVPARY